MKERNLYVSNFRVNFNKLLLLDQSYRGIYYEFLDNNLVYSERFYTYKTMHLEYILLLKAQDEQIAIIKIN